MPVIQLSIDSPLRGDHSAIITGVDWKTSSNDNPMIVVDFKIETGAMVKGYLVITHDGAMGFWELLRACGFENEAYHQFRAHTKNKKIPDFELEQLIGKELTIWIDANGFPQRYSLR